MMAVLAIDFGLIYLTRVQLQSAADAAAIAGAAALIEGDEQLAETRAITIAGENQAWRDGLETVGIGADDVTFPTSTRCRVTTHRTQGTGDALRTFFVGVLGAQRLANVTAVATAEAIDVCGTTCLKPWSVPDRWDDVNGNGEYDYGDPYTDLNGNDQWDPGEPFDDQNGNGVYDGPEPYDPLGTGYLPPADVGTPIQLKIGQPQDAITPGFFFAVDFPPLNSPQGTPETGASVYNWTIENCSPYTIRVGDHLQIEPGNMTGPTKDGAQHLIDQDPGAYWDSQSNSIEGSSYGTSPRLIKLAFFDPQALPPSGRNHVVVSKLGAFFLEDVAPNGTVTGRFMDLVTAGEDCGPNPGGLLYSVKLVE
jgi:hypothetical protein